METLPTPTNLFPTSSSSSFFVAPTLFTPPSECLTAALPDSSSGVIRANTLWITQTVGCVNTNIADPFYTLADCCGPFDTSGIVIKGDGQLCPVGYDAQDASVYGSKTTAACCPKGFTVVYPNLFCGNTESQTIEPTNGLTTVIVTSAFALQAVWDSKITSFLGTTAVFSFSSTSTVPTSSNTTAAAASTATHTTTLLSDPNAGSKFTGGLIGGVVGFVLVSWAVMAIVLACWFRQRKRRRQKRIARSWVDTSQTNIIQDAAPPGNVPEWRWSFGEDPKQIGIAHGDPSEHSSQEYGQHEKGESIEMTRTRPDNYRSDHAERHVWRPEVLRKPVAARHYRTPSSLSEGRSRNTSSLSEARSRHELTPEDVWRRDTKHYRNISGTSERRQRREVASEDAWWTDMSSIYRNNSGRSGKSRREASPGDGRRTEATLHKRSNSSASSGQSQTRRETTPDNTRKPEIARHQRNASSASDPWRAELTPVLEDPDRIIRFH